MLLRRESYWIGGSFMRIMSRWMLSRNGHLLVAVTFIGVVIILANFFSSNNLISRSASPLDLLGDFHSLKGLPEFRSARKPDSSEIRRKERMAVFSRIFQKQAVRKRKDTGQTCIHPQLDLKHDTNQFAYHDMPPLNCTGHSLFFEQNGIIILNRSVIDPQDLATCSFYGLQRVSDGVYAYTKPLVKESPPFDITMDQDFVRIRCVLKSTAEENEKLDKEEEKEVRAALGLAQDEDDSSQEKAGKEDRNDVKYEIPTSLIGFHKEGNSKNDKEEAKRGKMDNRAKIAEEYKDEGDQFYEEMFWEARFDFDDFFNPENEESDFDQFLVQVHPQPNVFHRISKTSHPTRKHPMKLNVLMIGLDSMSHLCFQRKLPLTYQFLKEELKAAILHSYNIVGDATTAALIPMLTGRTEIELPEVRQSEFYAGTVDEYPLIWKLFEEAGYVTLYAEDEPTIATFNLRFNGFHHQPTDHYMRPFWQALWDSHLRGNSRRYCTGDIPHHRFMLKYLQDFFLMYHNVSRFAFGFHGELTHWDNNPAEYMDTDLARFLRTLQRKGVLEDTVVIVMGDHGARYSKVRYTVQGKLEERLPMMSFVFPEKFRRTYPHLWHNIKTNTKRLSTPFDIYETLRDILDPARTAKPNGLTRGMSLLREIPTNRTCKQAGIGMHWCGCLHQVSVDTSEKFVKPAALELVSHLNLLTSQNRDDCAELHLKMVHSVFLVMPNEQVLKYLRSKDSDQRIANFSNTADPDVAHYQLQIETEPCGGLFEATVMANFRTEEYQYKVTPGISRINRYGNQPKCIQIKHPNMRKFCCCNSFFNSLRNGTRSS